MSATGKSLCLIKGTLSVAIDLEAEKSRGIARAVWDAVGDLERIGSGGTGGKQEIEAVKDKLIDAVVHYMPDYMEVCY